MPQSNLSFEQRNLHCPVISTPKKLVPTVGYITYIASHHVIILNTISKRQDGSDLFRILHTKSFSKFTEASVYYVIAVC